MPFSVFCEKWRIHCPWYTLPSCHLFFLSEVCCVFRVSWAGGRGLPLRDHSGWEGPHAREAGLDGGLILPSSPKLNCGRMKFWLFLMNRLRAASSFCLCCNFCGSKERLQGISKVGSWWTGCLMKCWAAPFHNDTFGALCFFGWWWRIEIFFLTKKQKPNGP